MAGCGLRPHGRARKPGRRFCAFLPRLALFEAVFDQPLRAWLWINRWQLPVWLAVRHVWLRVCGAFLYAGLSWPALPILAARILPTSFASSLFESQTTNSSSVFLDAAVTDVFKV